MATNKSLYQIRYSTECLKGMRTLLLHVSEIILLIDKHFINDANCRHLFFRK